MFTNEYIASGANDPDMALDPIILKLALNDRTNLAVLLAAFDFLHKLYAVSMALTIDDFTKVVELIIVSIVILDNRFVLVRLFVIVRTQHDKFFFDDIIFDLGIDVMFITSQDTLNHLLLAVI